VLYRHLLPVGKTGQHCLEQHFECDPAAKMMVSAAADMALQKTINRFAPVRDLYLLVRAAVY